MAFHSERLHLWTEDRVYGFMQSDGCAVVVDMPRYPEPEDAQTIRETLGWLSCAYAHWYPAYVRFWLMAA